MNLRAVAPVLCLLLAACAAEPAAPAAARPSATAAADEEQLARGEYLVRIAGCNDCHTHGYARAGGEVPKRDWLTGSPEGFNGPWGTTYASNLRLLLDGLDEEEWMAYSASLRTRPIMPDFSLRAMHADDRRALYRFIRSLGPAGDPAPAYLPPGQLPQAPYFSMVLPEAPPPAE